MRTTQVTFELAQMSGKERKTIASRLSSQYSPSGSDSTIIEQNREALNLPNSPPTSYSGDIIVIDKVKAMFGIRSSAQISGNFFVFVFLQ